jgi:hypothetical protein
MLLLHGLMSTILVTTAEGRTQRNNVSGDPRVSISLLDDENSYRMITITGEFLFLSDERVKTVSIR